MTYTRFSERLTELATRTVQSSRFAAIAIIVTFTSLAMQPAQAQSADTWKSVAIIGGSTAAGAYIGHKVGGRTGALVGAGVGASTGYAIDRRRRANEYYNQYGDNGYNGNNGGYYGNGAYYGNQDPYASGYQSYSYYANGNRYPSRR